MCNLKGKVALVTGAGSKRGIGHAVAFRLAQEGADVVVTDISAFGIRHTEDDDIEQWQGIKSAEAEIRSLGQRGLAVTADTSSAEQVEAMVAKCLAEFGKIDILVNNAGIVGTKSVPVLEIPEEEWLRAIKVNVMGTYLCSRAVASKMIERGEGGKIINIASINGKIYFRPGWGPYTVSKFGLVGLTQVLALELAPNKINVNAICPGFIATEIGLGAGIRRNVRGGTSLEEATAGAYANLLPQIPLGRAGQPEDIASLAAFLASSDADYMTGQSINVTGGWLMCH